jgi:phosphoribosylanthranilate isomerase
MFEVPLIQIAGVIDDAEAEMLVSCGVRYLGFPLGLPVHREDLSEDSAARIIRGLGSPCHGVLITYLDNARAVHATAGRLGARIVQLHGDIALDQLALLRELDPGLVVVKSLVVGRHSEAALSQRIERFSPHVDAFITDTYDPATRASGATGKTHDWRVSARLVARSPRPIVLAGGLTPDNVGPAIHRVRPAGVDVHTGVEGAGGRKSREKVEAFLAAARTAFGGLGHAG